MRAPQVSSDDGDTVVSREHIDGTTDQAISLLGFEHQDGSPTMGRAETSESGPSTSDVLAAVGN
jgi:hypothetical protein